MTRGGVGGILIIARTEFCQAQFKLGLTEPYVAVDINPAGFSLVCIFKSKKTQEESILIKKNYKDRKGK